MAHFQLSPASALLTVPIFASGASEAVSIPFQLEMLAIVIAAISGVLSARERKLDLIGAVGLAVIASLGGGLLRDMILQVGDVYILRQPYALPAAILTAAAVFVFPQLVENQDLLIGILDIFSVGLYSAIGADKAMVYGFEPVVCITMGFFTGVGGGMLRDVFMGQTPTIFKRGNFYAIASIGGAATYIALIEVGHVWNIAALVGCVAVTMVLRWVSIRFDIKSPTEIDLKLGAPAAVRHAMRPSKRSRKIRRRR